MTKQPDHSRDFETFLVPVPFVLLAPVAVDVPHRSARSLLYGLARGLGFSGIPLCPDQPAQADQWCRLYSHRIRVNDLGQAMTFRADGCDRTETQTVAASFCYEREPFVSFRHRGPTCRVEVTPQHLPVSFTDRPKLLEFQDALAYWTAPAQ